ncbi:ankyrin repeat family protein [Fowlpox virus]|nr:ankyrin repeat family protein [Fowlpox virus]AYO90600.1 ankyrin repeat family protein [Fowlpox virus]
MQGNVIHVDKLYKMMYTDNYETIKKYLEYTVIDKTENYSTSANLIPFIPLHQAIEARNIDIIKSIITVDNVNQPGHDDTYPIHIICKEPNMLAISYMLRSINQCSVFNTLVKIKDMFNYRNVEIAKIILTNRYKNIQDIDLKYIDKKSKDDIIEITKLLFSYGADINMVDRHGNSPLHYATENPDQRLTRLLLSKGANPNILNKTNKSPLYYSIESDNPDITMLLIDKFIFNNTDPILSHAIKHYRKPILHALIENGASINARDKYGNTPLHYAVSYCKDIDVIKLLLERGVDVNAKSYIRNLTPLHSSYLKSPRVLKLLLQYGADINSLDSYSLTPLTSVVLQYLCIECGRIVVSHICCLKRIKPDIENSLGFIDNIDAITSNKRLNQIRLKCEDELNRMASIKITNTYSFDVFVLCDNITLLCKLVNNSIIDDILINSFNIYKGIILKNIYRSRKRLYLIENTLYVLNNTFKPNYTWNRLPVELQNYIMEYIDDASLKVIHEYEKHKLKY